MPIIKLSAQATVEHQGDYGWEPSTVFEPVYINPDHIESFAWHGVTAIRMISGNTLSVKESPEEILSIIKGGINE